MMMPIFFHLESHLWIFYLLFFNGLLISHQLAANSKVYSELTDGFEARIIAGFVLSLVLNGLLMLICDWLELSWGSLIYLYPIISMVLIGSTVFFSRSSDTSYIGAINGINLVIYGMVFVLLFYNGGLIEQIADSWWHMSLANKMSYASSFTLEVGHLDGISSRSYPPLWHANLALLKLLSGESLPVIWNSFTAWGAVLKVMAYYLFALALCRDRIIALLACVLFVVIPGMGVSYLRVSAWPSHIAYIAWFSLFYVSFSILNKFSEGEYDTRYKGYKAFGLDLRNQYSNILAAVLLGAVIYLTHKLELLWFFIAMTIYLGSASLYQTFSQKDFPEKHAGPLRLLYRVAILLIVILSLLLLFKKRALLDSHTDRMLAYGLPIVLIACIAAAEFLKRRWLGTTLLVLALILVVLSINYTHIASLFMPELALPKGYSHAAPLVAIGYFGDSLAIPGWHLQLRSGLLYSGVVAIPVALILAYIQPDRATLFVSSCAVVAVLFCSSPYLYQWLRDVMAYHSSWRISLLIFTPLIMSLALTNVWRFLRTG